jgi:hypothetical protein
MRVFITVLVFFSLLFLSKIENMAQNSTQFEPQNTYVFIVGVLKWQDKNLVSFSNKNRKDAALAKILKKIGVLEENCVVLLDEQATLVEMKEKLTELTQKAPQNSAFWFYYAGHGNKNEKGETYFHNFDANLKDEKTSFNIHTLTQILNTNFKGNTVWLTADCCHSGGLAKEAELMKAENVIALTSATSSNSSTNNWTFTQTLLDVLAGNPLADKQKKGFISLQDLNTEIAEAMLFREKQLNGYFLKGMKNLDKNFIIVNSQKKIINNISSSFKLGDYVQAYHDNGWEAVRILGKSGNIYKCELYFYSDKKVHTFTEKQLKPFYFVNYPVEQEIEVEWNEKYYPAKILEVKNGFHYITYTDYESS